MGDDFPKLIYHSILCIGALVASRTANGYEVQAVEAPHIGQRTEKELIESFVNKIAQVAPQMVTFNGCAFDLPVLRYRAMIHEVFAPGMPNRAYFHRYTDDNVDLCDVLSSFSFGAKGEAGRTQSNHGTAGQAGRVRRLSGRGLLQRRPDPGDRGLLQVRRDQHRIGYGFGTNCFADGWIRTSLSSASWRYSSTLQRFSQLELRISTDVT
jgi:hypothetical protein